MRTVDELLKQLELSKGLIETLSQRTKDRMILSFEESHAREMISCMKYLNKLSNKNHPDVEANLPVILEYLSWMKINL
ncbi:MAG: hypothetical protein FWE29_05015 [Defluviitaleaceae bacterium]|nr:hypothetical protein [Defluviitaleaceae bacterium]